MSNGKKIAIGCGVLLALALVALLVGGFFVSRSLDGLREEGQVVMNEGRDFGRGRSSSACVDEGLRRLALCDGIVCQGTTQAWLQACLETCDREATMCEGVPREDEIRASVDWRLETCGAHAAADPQSCAQLMAAVQRACHPRGGT